MTQALNQGACNCGAVSFEVAADLTDIYVCHCSICRRTTGSSGIAVVVVDKTAFKWCSGADLISTWKKPESDWQTWFCSVCGSPVPGINDDARLFIPAGLLSDNGNLHVAHHIWVDSKAGWDEIGDNGRQHPEAFQAG